MYLDTENKINKLCIQGMEKEGLGKAEEAYDLYRQAWDLAENHLEKVVSAHFLARQQKDVRNKLKWDKVALDHAGEIGGELIKSFYPSLHLNLGKCDEDLEKYDLAEEHYHLAASFVSFLKEDGYGKLISGGIFSALNRNKSKIN